MNKETKTITVNPEDIEEIEREEPLEDIFEVVALTTKTHSNKEIYNRDWTLSELTRGELYFVRNQVKLIELTTQWLQQSNKPISSKTEIVAKRMKKNLLIDIHTTLILSRARKGRIVRGIIAYIIGEKEQARLENEQGKQDQSFLSRLFGKK